MGILLGEDESFGPGRAKNRLGVRTYQRRFKVFTYWGEGPYSAGSAPGLPVIGSIHPEDPQAWVQEIDVAPSENLNHPTYGKGWLWKITYDYSSENEILENPLLEPARLEWNSEQFQEEVWFNRNNEAIVNTAGDIIRNVTKDGTRLIATFTQNISYIPDWVIGALDRVNYDPFTLGGLPIGTNVAKFQGPSIPHRKIRNGITYYEVSGQIHFRGDQWKVYPPNVGLMQKLTTDTTKRIPCWADQLVPVSTPVQLDINGFQTPDPTESTMLYREDDVYYEYDFSTIMSFLIGL